MLSIYIANNFFLMISLSLHIYYKYSEVTRCCAIALTRSYFGVTSIYCDNIISCASPIIRLIYNNVPGVRYTGENSSTIALPDLTFTDVYSVVMIEQKTTYLKKGNMVIIVCKHCLAQINNSKKIKSYSCHGVAVLLRCGYVANNLANRCSASKWQLFSYWIKGWCQHRLTLVSEHRVVINTTSNLRPVKNSQLGRGLGY